MTKIWPRSFPLLLPVGALAALVVGIASDSFRQGVVLALAPVAIGLAYGGGGFALIRLVGGCSFCGQRNTCAMPPQAMGPLEDRTPPDVRRGRGLGEWLRRLAIAPPLDLRL